MPTRSVELAAILQKENKNEHEHENRLELHYGAWMLIVARFATKNPKFWIEKTISFVNYTKLFMYRGKNRTSSFFRQSLTVYYCQEKFVNLKMYYVMVWLDFVFLW